MLKQCRRDFRRGQILLAFLILLLGVIIPATGPAQAQDTAGSVYVVQIQGEIDLGLAPYLRRVLDEAAKVDAQAVILEINTPGGRLDAVLQMRDAILDAPVRTIAFVNREAFSAGALIAIAAEDIYMAPGAVMGAATPVEGTGETASEKVVSAVRKTFKTTAELRERDPRVAEAMVDPAVEIEGVVANGQLLTLTTTEASEHGYSDGVVPSIQDLLRVAGLGAVTVLDTTPSLAERLVRFLTNPIVASLLVSIGLLLFVGDALTEGFGIAGAAGLGLLATFFWGHYLAGLAGWEGIVLVVLGLILIGVEVFVIPGFGIFGILGLIALLAGVFVSLIGDQIVANEDLLRAGYTVGGAFLLIALGASVLIWYLPRTSRFQGLVLESRVGVSDAAPEPGRRHWLRVNRARAPQPVSTAMKPAEAQRPSLVGARGAALTDLRPGGFAQISGERVDVVTRGDYVVAGELVEVISDEGYRRVVRRIEGNSETA